MKHVLSFAVLYAPQRLGKTDLCIAQRWIGSSKKCLCVTRTQGKVSREMRLYGKFEGRDWGFYAGYQELAGTSEPWEAGAVGGKVSRGC